MTMPQSAPQLHHPLRTGQLTGAGGREDLGVADAQLEVEEAGGGGDAAVLGVGLLHRVAVLQGVNAHPGLIWGRHTLSSDSGASLGSTHSPDSRWRAGFLSDHS